MDGRTATARQQKQRWTLLMLLLPLPLLLLSWLWSPPLPLALIHCLMSDEEWRNEMKVVLPLRPRDPAHLHTTFAPSSLHDKCHLPYI